MQGGPSEDKGVDISRVTLTGSRVPDALRLSELRAQRRRHPIFTDP
jgi:hypothetical protein